MSKFSIFIFGLLVFPMVYLHDYSVRGEDGRFVRTIRVANYKNNGKQITATGDRNFGYTAQRKLARSMQYYNQ